MRVAVAGGTGTVGRHVVRAAEAAGHEVIVISRANGVDVRTPYRLSMALQRVDVVVDVLSVTPARLAPAEAFFVETTSRLQEVGAAVGVRHLVTLSILGVDRASGLGYYRAKLAQERAAFSGPVPATVLRASQFHEFPAQLLSMTRRGPLAPMVKMRSQPVAARTVGEHLVLAAETTPGRVLELAGPRVDEMPTLARRLLAARQVRALVVPVPIPGRWGRAIRRGALLARPGTTVDGATFDEWLQTEDGRAIPI